jgi:predicted DsbA family dithiol-disulfide isomerase
MSYELHPETPSGGILLSQRFPGMNLKEFWERLRQTYDFLGVHFGELSLLSNSRMALEASEYARDAGCFDSFHDHIFRAYFTETRDIGDLDVLLELAQEEDLDRADLRVALQEGRYTSRLNEARREGRQLGINAVPTFIINGKFKIVGAQSLDFFRDRLREIQGE